MQMIGKDDEGIDSGRMIAPRRGNRLAQQGDLVDERGVSSLQHVDREEEAPTRYMSATIVLHARWNSTSVGPVALVEMADYAFGSVRSNRSWCGGIS